MEFKNIPIYRSTIENKGPIANQELADKFNKMPIIVKEEDESERVVGMVDDSIFDGVDQILGNVWFMNSEIIKKKKIFTQTDIVFQKDSADNYIPLAIVVREGGELGKE